MSQTMHCAYSPNAEQANLNVIVIVLYLQVVILDHHYHCNNTFHVEKTYIIHVIKTIWPVMECHVLYCVNIYIHHLSY